MNWVGCGRKGSWPDLMFCSGIFLWEMRKNVSQNSMFMIWYLNQAGQQLIADLTSCVKIKYNARVLNVKGKLLTGQ
jgi:hypothetical protein